MVPCIILVMASIPRPVTMCMKHHINFFFFQAEDGIRDGRVTGVQTCALPISIVDRLLFRAPAMLRNPSLVHNVYLADTYRGKEHFNSGVQYQRYTDFTKWTTSFRDRKSVV